MANIQGQKKWSLIRLLETHELARGGVDGNLNEQAQALADRTELLREEKASKQEIIQGVYEFGTYAEFDAAKTSLPANCTVVIGEENTTDTVTWGFGNNRWNGSLLKKSEFDPLIKAKEYIEEKIEPIQQVLGRDAIESDEKLLIFGDDSQFDIAYFFWNKVLNTIGFTFGDIIFDRTNKDFIVKNELGIGFSLIEVIQKINNRLSIFKEMENQNGDIILYDESGFEFNISKFVNSNESAISSTSIVTQLNQLAYSEIIASRARVSHPVAKLKKDKINVFLVYGQSKAIGDEAFTVISRDLDTSLGNLMLGDCPRGANYTNAHGATFGVLGGSNVYKALREKWQNGSMITDAGADTWRLGESILSGFLNTLKTLHNDKVGMTNDAETVLAGSITGCVGTTISTLLKGAPENYYNRLYTCIEGHVAAAAALGKEIQIVGTLYLQGESDSSTSYETFYNSLKTLKSDIKEDIRSLTGQKDDPAFYIYQTGGVYQASTFDVEKAQMDLTADNDCFFLAPMSPYPQSATLKTHKSANGYRWFGCQAAHSVFNVLNGDNTNVFRMLKAVHMGNEVYVTFNPKVGRLTTKPFYVVGAPTTHADYGFTVTDNAGALRFANLNVQIVSANVVKITTSRELSGTVTVSLGDSSHGGQHNIADSSPQQALYNYEYFGDKGQSVNESISSLINKKYPLHNFAVNQSIISTLEV